MTPVSKIALLLITFFFGAVGGHKLHVKKFGQAAIYIVFIWTGIPSLVAFVEFILYIFKSEDDLQTAYPDVLSAGATAGAIIGAIIGAVLVVVLFSVILGMLGMATA